MNTLYIINHEIVPESVNIFNEEEFIKEAQRQRTVYDLETFIKLFNNEEISSHTHSVKLITKKQIGSWNVDDVIQAAESSDLDITYEQAEEILDSIKSKWDAEIGINWDIIIYYIEEYLNK